MVRKTKQLPQHKVLLKLFKFLSFLVFISWFYLTLAREYRLFNYLLFFIGMIPGYWIAKSVIDAWQEGWNNPRQTSRKLWQYGSGRKGLNIIIFSQVIPACACLFLGLMSYNKDISNTMASYMLYYQYYIIGSSLAWAYTHCLWLRRTVTLKPAIIPIVVAVGIAVVSKYFISLILIISESMLPTLYPGDRVVMIKHIGEVVQLERGDIIYFNLPEKSRNKLVKRVAGLPGEQIDIKQGKVHIGGEPMPCPDTTQAIYYFRPRNFNSHKIPKDGIFVLADNSSRGVDSRMWGSIPMKNVIGKVVLIYWPLERAGRVQ